jgi:hypothetical protein
MNIDDYYQIALDKLGWQEVTMWFRNGEYNHFENGHSAAEHPAPIHPAHKKLWSGGAWQKYLTYMIPGVCPKVFYP